MEAKNNLKKKGVFIDKTLQELQGSQCHVI